MRLGHVDGLDIDLQAREPARKSTLSINRPTFVAASAAAWP